MIYLYDNSFIGLLNLINYLLKNKIKPISIKPDNYDALLLDELYYPIIKEDENLTDRIISKIGTYAFSVVYYVYLSNSEDKELLIYNFLLESLNYKDKICFMRNIDCVSMCLKISKYVKHEGHKFKGFVRFRDLGNGILYSEIEPENNILLILSNHFKNRLKMEKWIINDKKRKLVSMYNGKEYYIFEKDIIINTSNISDDFENMWKSFYKNVSIKERANERCRMNFMPKKYWKYIVEVEDEKSC